MGNDWGSMLAGGLTQEGFSEEGTLGAEPALGGPGGGCLRWWEREEPAPRPGDGLGWSKTKVKPEWLGRVSEGKVGEDVWGHRQASDGAGVYSSWARHPQEKIQAGLGTAG